jgi:hypothetical protein
MNNADFGMTFQSLICKKYGIVPNDTANKQFKANFNDSYTLEIETKIRDIFTSIGKNPKKCVSFEKSKNKNERYLPYNFVLEDGSTLSIRTNKDSGKVAPRVIGQAGIDTLNKFFSDIFDTQIIEKNELRQQIIKHIDNVLPVFIDYLFNSTYTVWVFKNNNTDTFDYEIIDSRYHIDMDFDISNFEFTRGLGLWNESTTLKYKELAIAEIQIHKNRTFKFRFIMRNLINLLRIDQINNETIGITAEKAICDIFSIKYPSHLKTRSSLQIQRELDNVIKMAFEKIPKPIQHTGSSLGERGKKSKCSFDFILEGGYTLSLKTNKEKICPPEVGQPSATTCYEYFYPYIDGDKVTNDTFKNMVLNHIDKIIPIYVTHLFDSDYLLWIHKNKDKWIYDIFDKNTAKNIIWIKDKFSFTKPNIDEWYESNTVKYDNITIGEFQVHSHRNCFKFRFNMKNLKNILKGDY